MFDSLWHVKSDTLSNRSDRSWQDVVQSHALHHGRTSNSNSKKKMTFRNLKFGSSLAFLQLCGSRHLCYWCGWCWALHRAAAACRMMLMKVSLTSSYQNFWVGLENLRNKLGWGCCNNALQEDALRRTASFLHLDSRNMDPSDALQLPAVLLRRLCRRKHWSPQIGSHKSTTKMFCSKLETLRNIMKIWNINKLRQR